MSAMAYEWQRNRKTTTRHRILEAAATHFRNSGIGGASVAMIMKAAGYTVGGFYSHFSSKEDLVKKTFALMTEQVQGFVLSLKGKTGDERLKEFIDIYLSPSHRDKTSVGCPIAALATEVARENLEIRQLFANEIENLARQRQELFATTESQSSESDVYAHMSTYVGAIILARATRGTALSNRVLNSARRFLRNSIDQQTKDFTK